MDRISIPRWLRHVAHWRGRGFARASLLEELAAPNSYVVLTLIAAVAAFVIWLFSGGGFDPNAPHVNLNLSSNGYSNTLNDAPNYHLDITVTNSGTLTARNVRFMVTFYGANRAIVSVRESASVGDIPAGATMSFSIDVEPPTQAVTSTNITPLYDV